VRVESTVVPLTGDVRLTLEVEAAAPLAVEPPALAPVAGWRVRQTSEPEITPLPPDRQRWRQTVRLTPDRPGELPLPVPPLRVRPGGRETPVELAWQPLVVRVTTALPRVDLDEARGVTDPESAPPEAVYSWRDWRWAALGLPVVAIVAVWLVRRLRRPPPVPEPPPDVWAFAELDRLTRYDPTDPAAADALADLLRGFLERRYQLPAGGQTTDELLVRLPHLPLPPAALSSWQALLERGELARFARRGYSPDEWERALQAVRDLVTASVPVRQPEGVAPGGGVGGNA
jgi:hypothetical protein